MKTSLMVAIVGFLMVILDIFFGSIGSVERLAPIIVLCTALIISAIENK